MKRQDKHVPLDRLAAWAWAPAVSEDVDGLSERALSHLANCRRCTDDLTSLSAEAMELRDAAIAEADAAFDESTLDLQRTRILDRLAHIGKVARVLRFPRVTRQAAMPVSTGGRRWISVAAAAGLIMGLLAGQLVHFVPWGTTRDREQALGVQAPPLSRPTIVPVSASQTLTDDELLDEIEMAVQLRRARSLQALDALTPTVADALDFPPGR